MTTDNFCLYLQNRPIQTGKTGGQWYGDSSTFSIPWTNTLAYSYSSVASSTKEKNVFKTPTSGGTTSHRRRRKDIGSSSSASDGHVGLHPVSPLRPEVQRIRRRPPHSEMQGHQEQQAIDA